MLPDADTAAHKMVLPAVPAPDFAVQRLSQRLYMGRSSVLSRTELLHCRVRHLRDADQPQPMIDLYADMFRHKRFERMKQL